MVTGHYVFNASAIGLGGVLTSPKRKVIPSLASVALAPTGGEGSGIVTNYDDGDGISFDHAETRVFGTSQANNIYFTRADVTIHNLNVFNTLRVASMSAAVTSVRQVLDDGSVKDIAFTFQAEYLGVRANDKEIPVPVDTTVFDDNPSYDEFVKALDSPDLADYRKLIGLNNAKSLIRSPRGQGAPAEPPTICCTAVSPKRPKGLDGFHLHVPGVGNAHFAEALVKHGRRRLTLLRLDLQSVAPPHIGSDGMTPMMLDVTPATRDIGGGSGSMAVGSVEGNGTYTVP